MAEVDVAKRLCRTSWLHSRSYFLLSAALLSAGLSGCSALPSSGPTAGEIESAQGADAASGFRVENITVETVTVHSGSSVGDTVKLPAANLSQNVDAIGPGDILQVTVFEVGTSLFNAMAAGSMSASGASSLAPTAVGANLPLIQVDRDGVLTLPYVGKLNVAGKTPAEIQSLIAAGLKGKSQNPQVLVSVRERVWSVVTVMGEAKKPGQYPLIGPQQHLLDAIAAAGGTNELSQDIVVRITRGDASGSVRLAAVSVASPDNVLLLPQDRIELLYRPLSFSVFGAAGKVSEVPFQGPTVSLAQAVARIGGPLDQQADPSAVFVFRYNQAALDGTPEQGAKPVAYRLDMTNPESYFLAQRFEMHPRDVIYIANARSNQPTKLIQILGLFFSPAYSAKVLSQ
jgi:polysaccharide export outer membrane protein